MLPSQKTVKVMHGERQPEKNPKRKKEVEGWERKSGRACHGKGPVKAGAGRVERKHLSLCEMKEEGKTGRD